MSFSDEERAELIAALSRTADSKSEGMAGEQHRLALGYVHREGRRQPDHRFAEDYGGFLKTLPMLMTRID